MFVVGIVLLILKTQQQREASGHRSGANMTQKLGSVLGNKA